MANVHSIVPCLWFEDQAEEAAKFYTGVFKHSRIVRIARYSEAGKENHKRPAGSVMVVEFELNGQPFTALNGGPLFKFNEAVSLQVMTNDQAETDYFWEQLGAGGDPKAQACGWLKDEYGLSWQVVPIETVDMVADQESEGGKRAMAAMMKMKKIDIAAARRAYEGT